MDKKKVRFDSKHLPNNFDDDIIGSSDNNKSRRFKEKHSLDSDEEDNTVENQLHEDDIEGQEDTSVDVEDGIRFTPFNMKEELEEGHFDSEGTYIFRKEKEIQDNWIDSIDWVAVKETQKPGMDFKTPEEDVDEPEVNINDSYKEMLTMMKPGETVITALKRLGNKGKKQKSMSLSERLKAKKLQKPQVEDSNEITSEMNDSISDSDLATNKEAFLKLTGLADQLLHSGQLEIYQETFEKLTFRLKQASEEPSSSTSFKAVDSLDIFSDDPVEQPQIKKRKLSSSNADGENELSSTSKILSTDTKSDEVLWEYKWDQEENSEIYGQYSSEQMLQWTDEGYFADGIYARKVGSDGQFYSSRRIDFGLYV